MHGAKVHDVSTRAGVSVSNFLARVFCAILDCWKTIQERMSPHQDLKDNHNAQWHWKGKSRGVRAVLRWQARVFVPLFLLRPFSTGKLLFCVITTRPNCFQMMFTRSAQLRIIGTCVAEQPNLPPGGPEKEARAAMLAFCSHCSCSRWTSFRRSVASCRKRCGCYTFGKNQFWKAAWSDSWKCFFFVRVTGIMPCVRKELRKNPTLLFPSLVHLLVNFDFWKLHRNPAVLD